MKKFLLSVTALFFIAGFLVAQTSDPELDYIKSTYSKDKKLIMDDYLQLKMDDHEKFSQVYTEFEMERQKLSAKKLNLIKEFVSKADSLKPADADRLAKAALQNNADLDKLNLKFYIKLKDAIGPINAAKFFQLETYLQTTWRSIVQDNIPFIGELNKEKKN